MSENHIDNELHTHIHEDGTVHSHVHTHADGTVHSHAHGSEHEHSHEHGHDHGHTHDPAEIKKIVNRLSRSIGHLESVKQMLIDGKDCSDVLIQLAAVRSELNGAGKALLKEHISQCIVEAIEEGDEESVAKLNQAIDSFMK